MDLVIPVAGIVSQGAGSAHTSAADLEVRLIWVQVQVLFTP